MKHFILSFLLILTTSCGSGGGSSSSSASSTVTTMPTPNASGELIATVDSASGGNISASSLQLATNDPLSRFTSVEIPAGALSKNIDVKIFETGSLAIQIAPSEFGVTEIKKAGPALVIQGDSTALKSEITVSIPYDNSVSLNLADGQLAVLVLSGNNLEIFVGDQIIVGSKTIGVKVNHFGAFQVVKYLGVVMQQKATVQISDSNLKTVVAEAAIAVTPTPTPTPSITAAASEVVAATPVITTITPPNLEGIWLTEIVEEVDRYGEMDTLEIGRHCSSKKTVEIVGNTLKATTEIYTTNVDDVLDVACRSASKIYTRISIVTFTQGNVLTSDGQKPIDMTIVSNTVTPHNEAGYLEILRLYNKRISSTSLGTLQIGTAFDVCRSKKSVDSPELTLQGTRIFTTYKIQDNLLLFGTVHPMVGGVYMPDIGTSEEKRSPLINTAYMPYQ